MSLLFHQCKRGKNVESQFTVLENEKTALSGSLKEAKAARDEAMATVDSLRSECER